MSKSIERAEVAQRGDGKAHSFAKFSSGFDLELDLPITSPYVLESRNGMYGQILFF